MEWRATWDAICRSLRGGPDGCLELWIEIAEAEHRRNGMSKSMIWQGLFLDQAPKYDGEFVIFGSSINRSGVY